VPAAVLKSSQATSRLAGPLQPPSLASRPPTAKLRERSRAFTLPKLRERSRAFTLVELLVVMAIIGILLVLMAPAFTTLKSGADVTSAADAIKGVLDQARTYAMANNTYTWVGFYEENVSTPSTNPATPGIGRLVMSIVASKDGTMIYTAPVTIVTALPPANLIQVGKPTKIDNTHLLHLQSYPPTTPTSDTFGTRPAVSSTAAQLGDDTPPNPILRFQYPLGSTPQYTFSKMVQFNPRGEAVIDNSNYTYTPVSEIGFQPTHGSALSTSNVGAIQLTGLGGDVKIYRR
jgi:prepilin-type N-terminal cleavage/methylation domain-containing protein